jgi:hypothetical protein
MVAEDQVHRWLIKVIPRGSGQMPFDEPTAQAYDPSAPRNGWIHFVYETFQRRGQLTRISDLAACYGKVSALFDERVDAEFNY